LDQRPLVALLCCGDLNETRESSAVELYDPATHSLLDPAQRSAFFPPLRVAGIDYSAREARVSLIAAAWNSPTPTPTPTPTAVLGLTDSSRRVCTYLAVCDGAKVWVLQRRAADSAAAAAMVASAPSASSSSSSASASFQWRRLPDLDLSCGILKGDGNDNGNGNGNPFARKEWVRTTRQVTLCENFVYVLEVLDEHTGGRDRMAAPARLFRFDTATAAPSAGWVQCAACESMIVSRGLLLSVPF
jgi:hypothetical protein